MTHSQEAEAEMLQCHGCERESTDRSFLNECQSCEERFCSECFVFDNNECQRCATVTCNRCEDLVGYEDYRYCESCCNHYCEDCFGYEDCLNCEWEAIEDRFVEFMKGKQRYSYIKIRKLMEFLRKKYSSWNIIEDVKYDREKNIEEWVECYLDTVSIPENSDVRIGTVTWITITRS